MSNRASHIRAEINEHYRDELGHIKEDSVFQYLDTLVERLFQALDSDFKTNIFETKDKVKATS